MTIVERFLELDLPPEQCVVIGSGILDALELRKSDDIDLVVSSELFMQLQRLDEWVAQVKYDTAVVLKDDVEVWPNWGEDEETSFLNLYKDSVTIGGVHFVNPQFLLVWKRRRGREKDLRDVQLLEEYLSRE